jgi:hypothetical protein
MSRYFDDLRIIGKLNISDITGDPPVTNLGLDSNGFVVDAGSSFIYNRTLWVDPDGDDGTAEVGNFSKPWGTVQAAIQYALDNVPAATVHIMGGFYYEDKQIVSNSFDGVNVISEPGVLIVVDIDQYSPWIIDTDVYPIKLNWEGGFGFGDFRPDNIPPATIYIVSNNSTLYFSENESSLRLKNICVIGGANDDDYSQGLITMTVTIGETTAGRLYIDNCLIIGQGDYNPLIIASRTGFRGRIDIRNSKLVWNGRQVEEQEGNSSCIIAAKSEGINLDIRNSLIWSANDSIGDYPILIDFTTQLFIDDVQFHAVVKSITSTIVSIDSKEPTPIWIASRCVSDLDVPVGCSNPIFGILDCNLDLPIPLI